MAKPIRNNSPQIGIKKVIIVPSNAAQ